jgi:single-stranded-DNA-specific exonuclease
MRRRWLIPEARTEAEARLRSELAVSALLARLLVNRGLTDPVAAATFLSARLSEHLRSPMLFRDMPRAAERVVAALCRGEGIGIHGDYDVDGISGSAVLIRFFRALGVEPALYIPHRLREGYGLNEQGVCALAGAGVRVMITVDCGGVSHREIELARRRGIDVIVCDHHQVADTPLPACAVLNPIASDAGFPFSGLCGAGVAFYLALGVRMRLREAGASVLPDLRRSLDLVALGTIADLVPIVEENRVLVKYGLRELTRSEQPGLRALKTVSGVAEVNTGTVGFRLAPRLNAGGRLADARRSVELLTTGDAARAGELAASLDEENRARQALEREIFDEAVAMVEASGGVARRCSIVLASLDWHPGVVGIVASRLVERYYRPTILVALGAAAGLGRGSARSIHGVNVYDAIKACQESLEGFGGHRMAAGLSIRAEKVPELAERFECAVRARVTANDFVPVTDADCELPFSAINDECLRDLARLEPYGPGNPEPLFLARNVRVVSRRVVGDQHLKLYLEQEGRALPAVGFGMSDVELAPGNVIDVLFSPMVNEWAGAETLELRLRDIHTGATRGA